MIVFPLSEFERDPVLMTSLFLIFKTVHQKKFEKSAPSSIASSLPTLFFSTIVQIFLKKHFNRENFFIKFLFNFFPLFFCIFILTTFSCCQININLFPTLSRTFQIKMNVGKQRKKNWGKKFGKYKKNHKKDETIGKTLRLSQR